MLASPLTTLSSADKRIHQLAHSMFELNANGGCTEALLLAEGYSRHELATLGDAARVLANHRFVRADDAGEPTDEEVLAIAVDRCIGLVGTAAIITTLREARLQPRTIARMWDKITVKLATTVAKLPQPSAEDLRRAFA